MSGSNSGQDVLLVVSIDTEEDNWIPKRNRITIENIRELPKLASLFDRFGVRPTYLTTYQVAASRWASQILRDLHSNGPDGEPGMEIGAHLHPWNTPPRLEMPIPRNTMLVNLPEEIQKAKLEVLTHTLAGACQIRPRSFRAGRLGLGRSTVKVLQALGYEVDSSVLPYSNLIDFDDGPNFLGADLAPYRISGDFEPTVHDPTGPLVEVPLTIGFDRPAFRFWSRVHEAINQPWLRPLRLPGVASRLGLVQKIFLSPELDGTESMISLSNSLVRRGTRLLHMYFHSPTLKPGLSPFTPDQASVDRFYDTIESYLDWLMTEMPVRPVTLTEAAGILGPPLPSGNGRTLHSEHAGSSAYGG